MAKRATATKSKAKATKAPKRATVAKPKSAKKTAVKPIKRRSPAQSAELAAFARDIEGSIAEVRSEIGSFQTTVANLVKRLEADRKALEVRLIDVLTDALSPIKAQILVPLQQEVSNRLDGFGRQLTELAKALEPGSGQR